MARITKKMFLEDPFMKREYKIILEVVFLKWNKISELLPLNTEFSFTSTIEYVQQMNGFYPLTDEQVLFGQNCTNFRGPVYVSIMNYWISMKKRGYALYDENNKIDTKRWKLITRPEKR